MSGACMGHRIALSVEGLMRRARDIAGHDVYDEDVIEPLSVLLRSLNEDAFLHAAGARAWEEKLLRLLANRLRMRRDFAAHPEIAEQRITAPIVICGMGRTGSTKLQKLLAASGDFNWLPFWQSFNPCLLSGARDESVQPRIREAEMHCQWFDEMSPENKYGHHMEAHEPDEESFMLEQCFRTPCFLGWSELPAYLQWLGVEGMSTQFHYLHDLLKYLQWQGLQDAGKRWILKCPLYFGSEPLLREVFPDVSLLMTHRHPRETIPSSCRLLETFHQPFTDAPINYAGFLAGMAAQIQQHLEVRASRPEIHFLDIDFRQIVGNVEEVIGRVYVYCGERLEEPARHRMLDWNARNPKDKKGKHRYALADFGFTEVAIGEAFAGYIALLNDRFGRQVL